MRTIDQMITSEVLCCMSSLVSTLAAGYGAAVEHVDAYGRRSTNGSDLANLTEQAFELAAPIDDWGSAASEHGLTLEARADGLHVLSLPQPAADGSLSDMHFTAYDDSRQAAIAYCDFHGLEPYPTEVYEHWAVTDWFADKLEAAGEKVDRDFAGLCVWGRTTTGQSIAMDSVVARIYAETHTA